MAMMKKTPAKKMQMGGMAKAAPMMKKGGSVDSYTNYAKTSGKADTYTDISGKTSKPDSYTQYKKGGVVKAKNGKSFPDLNKDGKITKADILKGRGVIAKKGASVRKAGFGDILGKVAGSGALGLAGMAANKLFGGKKKEAAPGMAPAAPAVTPPMKKGGKVAAKKKMKSGGKMSKCKYGCN